MARVIIVHTFEHVATALEAASELHTPLTLQSAPDAIYYAGSLYLLHMFQQARRLYPQVEARFVLDCSDAGAEAIAAMQVGHRLLLSSAPEEIRAKIADIAAQYGGEMAMPAEQSLDLLFARNPLVACREWLTRAND